MNPIQSLVSYEISSESETESVDIDPKLDIEIKQEVDNSHVDILDLPALGNYREQEIIDLPDESSDSSSDSSIHLSSSDDNASSDEDESSSKQKPSRKIYNPYWKEDSEKNRLPPIEDLCISVKEEEAKVIGEVCNIIGNQVIVKAHRNIPPIDLNSVLFLDGGKRTLGHVFEVFGKIDEPLYIVRFNSQEQIHEKEITKGREVYFAPETEHTSFVVLDELMRTKGSDASYLEDIETPENRIDYSDDEEERKAKQARRRKRIGNTEARVDQRHSKSSNPFSETSRDTTFTNPSRNEAYKPFHKSNYNNRHSFGGRPNFRTQFPGSGLLPSPAYDRTCSPIPPAQLDNFGRREAHYPPHRDHFPPPTASYRRQITTSFVSSHTSNIQAPFIRTPPPPLLMPPSTFSNYEIPRPYSQISLPPPINYCQTPPPPLHQPPIISTPPPVLAPFNPHEQYATHAAGSSSGNFQHPTAPLPCFQIPPPMIRTQRDGIFDQSITAPAAPSWGQPPPGHHPFNE